MNPEIEIKPTVIYSSYTEAQKRATQKYRITNKDKVNERRKLYYQQRKTKDPEFLEYKRQKAREYYQRQKAIKTEPIIEPVIEKVIEPVIETVIPIIEKPKRIYKKAIKSVEPVSIVEDVKPVIVDVKVEPEQCTPITPKVKKPKTIKAKSTKSTEVVGVVHEGDIVKLQINGEDFVFQHDPTKAIKEELVSSESIKKARKRVNTSKALTKRISNID